MMHGVQWIKELMAMVERDKAENSPKSLIIHDRIKPFSVKSSPTAAISACSALRNCSAAAGPEFCLWNTPKIWQSFWKKIRKH